MKKLFLPLLMMVSFITISKAQSIGTSIDDKMYKSWETGKLYVVKTANAEINAKLESAVKASFPNFTGSVSEAEADKLMDNENNFFVTIYYNGQMKIKQNAWDKFMMGIGIFQGKEKKLQKIDIYKDFLIRQDYLPVAPNMNITFLAGVARKVYTDNGLDKTFKPEPTILTIIPFTITGFKQMIDALVKTGGEKKPVLVHKAVAKVMRENATILKDKTLLVLDNEITDAFYNGYSFKKEKIKPNDLSKLESKDKNYCFLIYYIDERTSIRQITVIDCETNKIIYQDAGLTATTADKMQKKYADSMNNAVNGKVFE